MQSPANSKLTRLPERAYVGPFEYPIRPGGDMGPDPANWGTVYYPTRTIHIATHEQSAASQREVLLHELVHAVDNNVHSAAGSLRLTEDQVWAMSIGLFDLLTDERNRPLVDFIVHGKRPSQPVTKRRRVAKNGSKKRRRG